MAHKVKLTVTVDEEIARELQVTSRQLRRATSNLVEEAIRLWRRQRLEEALRQGYEAMAKEDLATAKGALRVGWEAIK